MPTPGTKLTTRNLCLIDRDRFLVSGRARAISVLLLPRKRKYSPAFQSGNLHEPVSLPFRGGTRSDICIHWTYQKQLSSRYGKGNPTFHADNRVPVCRSYDGLRWKIKEGGAIR